MPGPLCVRGACSKRCSADAGLREHLQDGPLSLTDYLAIATGVGHAIRPGEDPVVIRVFSEDAEPTRESPIAHEELDGDRGYWELAEQVSLLMLELVHSRPSFLTAFL